MKVARLSALSTDRLYLPGDIPGTHSTYKLSNPRATVWNSLECKKQNARYMIKSYIALFCSTAVGKSSGRYNLYELRLWRAWGSRLFCHTGTSCWRVQKIRDKGRVMFGTPLRSRGKSSDGHVGITTCPQFGSLSSLDSRVLVALSWITDCHHYYVTRNALL